MPGRVSAAAWPAILGVVPTAADETHGSAGEEIRQSGVSETTALERRVEVVGGAVGLAWLEQVAEEARDYAARAKAANTLKAYRTDWADFTAWCGLHRLDPLPASPETIALYLSDLARTHKVSTLYRRLSGISQAHQAAGYVTPTKDAQ